MQHNNIQVTRSLSDLPENKNWAHFHWTEVQYTTRVGFKSPLWKYGICSHLNLEKSQKVLGFRTLNKDLKCCTFCSLIKKKHCTREFLCIVKCSCFHLSSRCCLEYLKSCRKTWSSSTSSSSNAAVIKAKEAQIRF